MTKEAKNNKEYNDNALLSLFICFFLTVSILVVYLQITQHEFINYDDNEYVSENRLVQKGLTSESICQAFSIETAGNWHPITILSHMLDYHMYGLQAGHHLLTNLILHIFNTIILFFLMKKMTKYVWRSAIVAMLFALHPVHVESVAWVSERKDILSMLFWLLTVWSYTCYVESGNIKHYFQVFIFLVLGLMTKPMLVTLPFVLLLFDIWPLNRFKSADMSSTKLIFEKLPLLIPVIISCAITLAYQKEGSALKTFASYPLTLRIENAIVSYITYTKKLYWPFDLSVFYPYPEKLSFQQISLSFSLLTIITIVSLFYLKKKSWLFTGWFLYIGMLIPVIGFVQVGSQAFADRYTYIPAIGIFIITVWFGAEFLSRYRQSKKIAAVFLSIAILLLIMLSRHQAAYWKNSVTLFKHALEVTDQNYLAHNNLGLALKQNGNIHEAIEHYRSALSIRPNYVLAHNNLGVALSEIGETEDVLSHFSLAIKLMPEFIAPHINMASAFFDKRAFEKALEHCRNALKVDQDSVDLFIICGDALSAIGNPDEARARYQKALQLDPDSAKAHNHFGAFLLKQNDIDNAIVHFQIASKINPHDKKYSVNLQTILDLKRKLDTAVQEQLKKLETNPNDPRIHTLLGNLYDKTGKKEAAINHYEKALDNDPEFIPALSALALQHASKKEYDDAVFLFKKVLKIDANQPEIYYNIACLYSKQNQIENALIWLQKAIEKGYNNWETIKSDKDLENIRHTSKYSRLLGLQRN